MGPVINVAAEPTSPAAATGDAPSVAELAVSDRMMQAAMQTAWSNGLFQRFIPIEDATVNFVKLREVIAAALSAKT
jgi:hypothetical protein